MATYLSILVFFGGSLSTFSVPLSSFYPFGTSSGDTLFPPSDDYSIYINLSLPFRFYNKSYNRVYINNNGDLSYLSALNDYKGLPFPLNYPVIAPYWADVDTLGTGSVYYRETSNTSIILKVASHVSNAFPSQSPFNPISVVIATWDRVGYYSQRTDKTNTFQCITATDGYRSYLIFLYLDNGIQWTTGDSNEGHNGLGGTQALVGFNAGDNTNYYEVPESRTYSIVNIETTSNVGVAGMWVFQVNNESNIVFNDTSCDLLQVSPGTLGGLTVSQNGTTVYSIATYSCNQTGYILNETTNRVCQNDGTWTGTVPLCQLINCGVPRLPLFNSTGLILTYSNVTYGSTVIYSCIDGYNLVGNPNQTCTISGNWSDTPPQCQVINCGVPSLSLFNLTGLILTYSNVTYGNTVTYSCIDGYNLVGNPNHTCTISGNWSDTPPQCQVISCGVPDLPTVNSKGLTVTYSTLTYGSIATYRCNAGKTLVGNSTRSCNASGNWSGNSPQCLVPPTVYPNHKDYNIVGVKDYNISLGFVVIPPVQLHNIQWHFTNQLGQTVDLLANNSRDSRHTFQTVDFLANNSRDSRHTISGNIHSLLIQSIQLHDRGNYTLTAANEAGNSSATLHLEVHVQCKLSNKTGGYVIVSGTEHTRKFNCSADGMPPPIILWRRNGHLILNSTRITIIDSTVPNSQRSIRFKSMSMIKEVISIMTITSMRETDNGNYTCQAYNFVGEVDTLKKPIKVNLSYVPQPKSCEIDKNKNICQNGGTCQDLSHGRFKCLCTEKFTGIHCQEMVVRVIIPPSINDVVAVVGIHSVTQKRLSNYATGEFLQPLKLTCNSNGNPIPTITWYKSNKIILDKEKTLVIEELDVNDRGYYKCAATNSNGRVESSEFLVNISGLLQYKMDVNINNTGIHNQQQLEELITKINYEVTRGMVLGRSGIFVSVVMKSNFSDALRKKEVTVILTLLTKEQGSNTLLQMIQSYMSKPQKRLQTELNIYIENETIARFDGCPASVTRIPSPFGYPDLYLHWPETNLGDTAMINCPCEDLNLNSTTMIATRRCEGTYKDGAVWQEHPNDTKCNLSIITREICILAQKPTEEIMEQLRVLTENSQSFKTSEVTAVVAVLVRVTENVTGNITLTENYFDVVDNLVTISAKVLQESQSEAKTTSKLLKSIEILTEQLPIPDNESIVIARNNFAVAAQEVKSDMFALKGQVISLDLGENAFDGQGFGNSTFEFNNNLKIIPLTASLALPHNLFKALANQNFSQNSTRLTSSVFLSDSLFQRREKRHREVGSIIMSAGVVGINNVTGLTNPPVILVFQINPAIKNGTDPLCSYWDETLDNGFGDWSSKGCSRNMTYNENQTFVICHCTHLTTFSILLDVTPEIKHTVQERPIDKSLSAITYIGAIVSIFCLLITISSYVSHKKLRTTEHGQLLLNLCFSLLGLYIVFIVAIHSKGVNILCTIVAALLQYFFLVTFMIMAAEAIHLYIKFVIVLGWKIYHYVLKTAILSWVLPVFIVIFCIAPDYKNYFSSHFCRAFGLPFYLGMIVPFLIIYIFNWIVFIVIFTSLLRKGCNNKTKEVINKRRNKKEKKNSQVKQQLLVAVTLSILFGLGWGAGLLATDKIHVSAIRDICASLFVILSTLQGLFIFFIHCLRSSDVRSFWAGWFSGSKGKQLTTSITAKPNQHSNQTATNTNMDTVEEMAQNERLPKRIITKIDNGSEEFTINTSENDQFSIHQNIVEENNCSPSFIFIEKAEIIGSERDSGNAELACGVTTFQVPDSVHDYICDSMSVGGMTTVSDGGIECVVYHKPIHLKETFGLSNSAPQQSFKSADIVDISQTSFINPT